MGHKGLSIYFRPVCTGWLWPYMCKNILHLFFLKLSMCKISLILMFLLFTILNFLLKLCLFRNTHYAVIISIHIPNEMWYINIFEQIKFDRLAEDTSRWVPYCFKKHKNWSFKKYIEIILVEFSVSKIINIILIIWIKKDDNKNE